jgi:hypothetical protein
VPLQPYKYIQPLHWMSSNSFGCTIIQFQCCPAPLGIAVVLLVGRGGARSRLCGQLEWLPPGGAKVPEQATQAPPRGSTWIRCTNTQGVSASKENPTLCGLTALMELRHIFSDTHGLPECMSSLSRHSCTHTDNQFCSGRIGGSFTGTAEVVETSRREERHTHNPTAHRRNTPYGNQDRRHTPCSNYLHIHTGANHTPCQCLNTLRPLPTDKSVSCQAGCSMPCNFESAAA